MSPVFVDTPVLLSAVDDADLARRDRARDWLAACWLRRCGRLSTPVLNEYYVGAKQRFPQAITQGDARAEIRRYQLWRPWAIDHPTMETAWAFEARYGLAYRDALMLAAAQHQGCRLVLSEQLPHDRQIDGLRILNPFLAGPEVLDTAAAA